MTSSLNILRLVSDSASTSRDDDCISATAPNADYYYDDDDDDDVILARIRRRALTSSDASRRRRRSSTKKTPPATVAPPSRTAGDRGITASLTSFSLDENDETTSTDSDFYDTDLEIDEQPANDVSGSQSTITASALAYRAACIQSNIAPQEAIALSLPETEVNIRYRCLGDDDIKALAAGLTTNQTVTRLELAGNNLGGLGANCLKDALVFNTNIDYLDLSDNDLGRHQASAIAIGELLRANTCLQTLKLAGNNFRDHDVIYLAVGIRINNRLVNCDLSRNVIGETGSIHLGRAFAVNNSVDVLDLSWNSIRQKGAVGLCKGLQRNGYVSKLNLAWNGLGYEGSLALGELLKKNSTLVAIDVTANRINWQGIQFVAKGLTKNKTLETLILDSNPLTTTGCMDLIEAISEPQSAVINLSLKGIPVIGDFELMSMMVRRTRPDFRCVHGGLVSSHDVIGQRLDKRVTPVQKVINFMKQREYRTAELFRMLDGDVSRTLTQEELATRLRRVGVSLPPHEIDELLEFLNTQLPGQGGAAAQPINYKTMARGVKGHQELQRLEKIREQEHDQRMRTRHRKILTEPDSVGVIGLADAAADAGAIYPPIGAPSTDGGATRSVTGYAASKVSFTTIGTSDVEGKRRAAKSNPLLGNRNSGIISMSTTLGSKAVAFGTAEIKKKKKQKGGSKKSKKKKNKDTTDYDSMI